MGKCTDTWLIYYPSKQIEPYDDWWGYTTVTAKNSQLNAVGLSHQAGTHLSPSGQELLYREQVSCWEGKIQSWD